MKTVATVATMLLALTAGIPVPVLAQQTAAERSQLQQYQSHAGAPVDEVHYFRIDGFAYLAPDKLAIWFGVNKMYLLSVETPCVGLAFANAISLTSRQTLRARFDSVEFGHQQCRIMKIQPVDELRMKQDAGKAKAAAASGR